MRAQLVVRPIRKSEAPIGGVMTDRSRSFHRCLQTGLRRRIDRPVTCTTQDIANGRIGDNSLPRRQVEARTRHGRTPASQDGRPGREGARSRRRGVTQEVSVCKKPIKVRCGTEPPKRCTCQDAANRCRG